jgi:hypothetical protein
LFATDKKWDLNNIKLKAVTAQGIFFDASFPALVIDQTAKKPIRLGDVFVEVVNEFNFCH